MKRINLIIITLVLVLSLSMFSCKKEEERLKVLLPEGIPSIALGALFDNDDIEFTTVNGSDMLSSALIDGEYDVVVAPIIMGATLYTKNIKNYKLASTITLGNSYIVGLKSNEISDLKELEGEKIASYGENTAPDIVLKAALVKAGVDLSKVEFVYENSVADVFANRFMSNDACKYILSAEPIISKMEVKKYNGENSLFRFDLQEVLKDDIEYILQAGIFVRDNGKNYDDFLNKVSNNVTYLNNNTLEYVDTLFALKSDKKIIFENIGKNVIVKSIPSSNIYFIKAKENKDKFDKYFDMINTYNKNILKENVIDEAFYY